MQRSRSTALVQQVKRTVARYEMMTPGDRVLVAVSGGPDSIALLSALSTLSAHFGIEICAAHLNHHLRGDEALRDQECAETVASQLGVRCVVGEASGLGAGANLESRAREVRYRFLGQVAGTEGCTRIATGHTLDDQAETFLMRLLRGSGGDGLAGIRPVREGRIVRPLIECGRLRVLAHLRASGLPYREDSSNADRRFLRNRIRHDVIPLLRSINPKIIQRLASTAGTVAAETDWLEGYVKCILAPVTSGDSLLLASVVEAPAALRSRLVRAWLREQRGHLRGVTAAHLHAVVDLACGTRPNARVRLPGGQLVIREYERLRWRTHLAERAADSERVLRPGAAVTLESGWRISARVMPAMDEGRPVDLWEAVADADAVRAPLIVRGARPGDRIRPFGMRGHRKLQDIFVDRKVPCAARWSCPVVECEGEVFWVPGVVRSNRAPITPATRSTLRLAARKLGIAAP